MRYSPESLEAFVQTVASGSFSAAARALKKSQSTVSVAVVNLEADLGFALFDRRGRQPQLTEQGRRVLPQVQQILAASERLDALATRLSEGTEPRLSVAVSDFWQTHYHQRLLKQFDQHYPDVELEGIAAEDDDVVELLQTGRAHIGVIRAQPTLPADIAIARLQVDAELGVYLHRDHPWRGKPRSAKVSSNLFVTCASIPGPIVVHRLSRGEPGLLKPIMCCWRWRNRALAGVFYPVGW